MAELGTQEEESRDVDLIARLLSAFPVRVRNVPGEGLCLTASRHICIGEVVCSSRPYAAIVCYSQKAHNPICHGCFEYITRKKGQSTTIFSGCGQAAYCSRECKERSSMLRETSHIQEECKAFKKLGRVDCLTDTEKSECRLIVRILARRLLELRERKRKEEELTKMKQAGTVPQDAVVPERFEEGEQQFCELMTLVTNVSQYKLIRPDIQKSLELKTKTILSILHGSELLSGISEQTIFALLCKEQCNSYGIWSANSTMRGIAVYPVASFFNHSCYPNLVHHCTGTQLEIRALVPIEEGSSICISYVEITDDTYLKRADWLWNFCFTCNCPRCSSKDNPEIWKSVSKFCCRKRACTGTLGLHWKPEKNPQQQQQQPFLQCNLCGSIEIPPQQEIQCSCNRSKPQLI